MSHWQEHWPGGAVTHIHVPRTFHDWRELVPEGRTCLVVDKNLLAHHAERFKGRPLIPFHATESTKILDSVTMIHQELLRLEADRSWTLIGVGGGITTDVTGFAAATYMRGMRLILAPTSLLAQVDAAIGGKTGVNFQQYKNLVGAFYQPEHILIDPDVLRSLPVCEWRNGMAEVVKHACLSGPEQLDMLGTWNLTHIRRKDVLVPLLKESIRTKLSVVRRDMRESGVRRFLNLGHTFAHALERTGKATHGEAVSIGLALAAALSERLGVADEGLKERIESVLQRFELPTRSPVPVSRLLAHMRHDKKRKGDNIPFVLLRHIGDPVLHDVPVLALKEVIGDLCQSC